MIIRGVCFLLILISALFLPFWVFVCAIAIYGFVYAPYELLLIGVLVDAQFGGVGLGQDYLYTLTTAVSAIILVILKPQLRMRP